MNKLTRLIVLVVAAILFCGQNGDAKYRLLSPEEMIGNAEFIAVVDVPSVEKKDTASGNFVYTEWALAKIEQTIKGSEKRVELVGNRKTKVCAPDCTLEPGRQLIFIRKLPDCKYTSANSGIGLIPIRNNQVSWFTDLTNLNNRVDVPLAKAIADIRSVCKSPR